MPNGKFEQFERLPAPPVEKLPDLDLEKKVNEKKKEIFKGVGEHSPEKISEKIEALENLLKKEKEEGRGKLKDTISEIEAGPYGNEYFVDKSVAYLPKKGKAIFVGDIHGDAEAASSIVEQTKFIEKMEKGEKDIFLIFLGDYTDRGKRDVASIEEVINLKLLYPKNVVLLRGNHEEEAIGKKYGLYYSLIVEKYGRVDGERLFEKYNEMVKEMPGVVVTGNGIVGVHGGIPNYEINSLKDLDNEEILWQMRWNDPTPETLERINSDRDRQQGYFKLFGRAAFERFMGKIGGKVMIRSHQYFSEGLDIKFDGKLATIFSNGSKESPSSGYKDRVNRAMFASVDLKDLKERFVPQDFKEVLYTKIERPSPVPTEKPLVERPPVEKPSEEKEKIPVTPAKEEIPKEVKKGGMVDRILKILVDIPGKAIEKVLLKIGDIIEKSLGRIPGIDRAGEAIEKSLLKIGDVIEKGGTRLAILGLKPAQVIEQIGKKVFLKPLAVLEEFRMFKAAGRSWEQVIKKLGRGSTLDRGKENG